MGNNGDSTYRSNPMRRSQIGCRRRNSPGTLSNKLDVKLAPPPIISCSSYLSVTLPVAFRTAASSGDSENLINLCTATSNIAPDPMVRTFSNYEVTRFQSSVCELFAMSNVCELIALLSPLTLLLSFQQIFFFRIEHKYL